MTEEDEFREFKAWKAEIESRQAPPPKKEFLTTGLFALLAAVMVIGGIIWAASSAPSVSPTPERIAAQACSQDWHKCADQLDIHEREQSDGE